jgi:hypothetical protein
VFSEAINPATFTGTDVAITGTAGGTKTVALSSSDNITWTASVTGMTTGGTVIADIAAGLVQDLAGNSNTASTFTDRQVTWNPVPPTVTINQAAANPDPDNTSPILFTIVFSEAINPATFTGTDVVITGTAGGTKSVALSTSDNITWTATVTGMTTSGTVIANIPANAVQDLGGNNNTASTSTDNTVTWDVTAPTVTVNQAAANPDPDNTSPILFTIVFSEAIAPASFTAADVVITGTSGGTKSVALSTSDNITWTATVTGMTTAGTVIANIAAGAVQDLAGNNNIASTSTDNTVTWDATPPTVTINQAAAQPDPTNTSPIVFTIVFSEAINPATFTNADVAITGTAGGTKVVALSTSDNITWTASVTGMTTPGTVIANIAANAAQDPAGNNSAAATFTDNQVNWDATGLGVTVNQSVANPDPDNTSPILFTVVFTKAINPATFTGTDVTITGTAGGTKTVALATSDNITWTATVTGMTTSGTVIASMAANVVQDPATNWNTASSSTDNQVTWDVLPPTVTINQAAAQADPTGTAPILFTIIFSEAINPATFTNTDVAITGTAGGTKVVALSTSDNITWTATVTGMTTSGTVIANIAANAAQDPAGNNSAAATFTDNQVTWDVIAPTVTINQAAAQADPTGTSPILFTIVFSEAINPATFTNADVTITGTAGGTKTVVLAGGPTTWTASVSGMTTGGTVIANIAASAAQDPAGNNSAAATSTDNTVIWDPVAPTVTINQAVANPDPDNASPILFTIVFSEAINPATFTSADVVITGTAGGTKAVALSTTDNITWTATVTGMGAAGTVIANIPAGAAQDPAGNNSAASTSTDNTVTWDATPPTVTINQAAAQGDPTGTAPITFTIIFSEAIVPATFTNSDVTIGGTAGGTKTVALSTLDNITWTATVTGMTTPGTVTATIPAAAAQDAAGNNSAASTSTDNQVTWDNVPPTVTINQAAANPDPDNTSPILFTIVFSEAIVPATFTNADVAITGTAGGTKSVALSTTDNITWTATVTGMTTPGTVIANIAAAAAQDAAGNNSAAATFTDNQVTWDNVPPTVTINQAAAQNDPTGIEPIAFTIVFSEAINPATFTNADVTISGTAGGTKTVVVTTSDNITWTANVSGMTTPGTVIATIPANAAQDAAGNNSTVSTSTDNTVTWDNSTLDVSVNQAVGQPDPDNTSPILFTVVFNRAITPATFTGSDVVITGTAGGTKSVALSTSDNITWTATVTGMTTGGTVIANIPANAVQDAALNWNVASTSADNSVTWDVIAPTVTINQAVAQVDPTGTAPINFTVVFSEAINPASFTGSDVAISGTAGGPKTVTLTTSDNITWNAAVTGMTTAGTVIADMAANAVQDAAGNNSGASTSTDNTVYWDATPPTVIINQAVAQPDPDNTSPILFTVVFSEAINPATFTNADVAISGTAGGTKTVALSTSDNITWTVTVTGMTTPGTVVASIGANLVQDLAGNGNAASTSTDNSVGWDATPPTVTINQAAAQADPTNAAPILFTIVFSEAIVPASFTSADVAIAGTAGGTKSVSLSTSDNITWTASVTGMTTPGTVVATIAAGAAQDAAGNNSAASTSIDNTVNWDATSPTVTINQAAAQVDPTNTAPILFTIVFSEAIVPATFTSADVTITGTAGGTKVVALSGGPTTWTATITGMTTAGTVIANIAANAAQDAAGNNSAAATFTDNVVTWDATPPTVTINQAAAQADPTGVAPITFTIVFSEVIVGASFTNADVAITGTAGGTKVVSLSTSDNITWSATVTGMTTNGTVIANIAANAAQDAAGNNSAAATFTDNTVTWDAVAPTVTINQAAANPDPDNTSPILFTIVFSEAINPATFTATDVVITGTAGGTINVALSTSDNITWTATVTGMTTPGTVIANIAAATVQDPAGNNNAAATFTDNTVTWDATVPTVTINQAAAQADPTGIEPIAFTIVFSEAINPATFTNADVIISGTAGPATKTVVVTTSDNITWTASVSGMTTPGTVIATIPANAAQDAAGNNSTASTSLDNTVNWDNSTLSVSVNQAVGQPDPDNTSPILFTVVFNRAITPATFTGSDVVITGTAGGTKSVALSTSDNTIWTATVTGMTTSGTVIANIPANAVQDPASNWNVASTSADNQVTWDVTAPTATINQAGAQGDPTGTAPINFTVVFSEAINPATFTGADVAITGTAGGTKTVTLTTSDNITWNAAVTGMTTSGTVIANIAASAVQDAAGNNSAAATFTDNQVTWDVLAPTVTINQAAAQPDPDNTSPILFTIVFSEAINPASFTDSDVAIAGTSGGAKSVALSTSDNITWTATVTGMTTSGTVVATIGANSVQDMAGNGNTASTSTDNTVTWDATPPTVTIDQAAAQLDPTNAAPITFTIVFSEAVTPASFTNADVTITGTAGGTKVVALSTSDNITWTATVTGMTTAGTVIANIAAGAALDAAGNGNLASTSTDNTVNWDATAPTVTVNQAAAQADPTNTTPILYTIVFSKAIDPGTFTGGDVTISGTAGGTKSVALATADNITWTATVTGMTSAGTVIASIAAGNVSDLVGNTNAASTSTDNTVNWDATAPTVTINQAAAQVDPTNTAPILFTIVFSEAIVPASFTNTDVAIGGSSGGTKTVALSTSDNITWTASVTGMTTPGTVVASIAANAAQDAAGNDSAAATSTDNTVVWDNVGPTVTINQAAAQADPAGAAPIAFTIVFSEAIAPASFTGTDVVITGTAGGAKLVTLSTSDNITWNADVTGMTTNGTVIANIAANAAQDAAGNNSAAATFTDNTVTWNTLVASVAGVTVLTGHTVQVTFTKDMGASALVATNYTVTGGGRGSLASNPDNVAGSGSVYTLTWACPQIMKNGDAFTITVAATVLDSIGNPISPPLSASGTAIATLPVSTSLTPSTNPVTIECGVTYTVPVSTWEDSCGNAIVSGVNGNILPENLDGLDLLSPDVSAYTVVLSAADAANNVGTLDLEVTVTDTQAPVITLTGADPLSININDPYVELGATAADACAGVLTGAIVIDASAVDTSVEGTYVVTYNVSDPSSNPATEETRTVNVIDSDEPFVTAVVVEDSLNVLVTFSRAMGAGVTDETNYTVSGSGMGSLGASPDSVALDAGNTYRLTWSCPDLMTDGGDITITVASTVEADNSNTMLVGGESGTDAGGAIATIPVLTLVGDDPVELNLDDTYTEEGATAVDGCGTDISLSVVVAGDAVDTATAGTYVVTYNVSDGADNAAVELTRTVNVTDSGSTLAVAPIADIEIAEGGNGSLSAVATGGTETYTYVWSIWDDNTTSFVALTEGGGYAGVDTATLTIDPFDSATMVGQYQVEVNDGVDTVTRTANVTLEVVGVPVAGGLGLAALALAAALSGVAALRRKK